MNKQGFTLVELIVTIAVIVILAGVSVVAYNGTQARARDTDRMSDLQNIADAIKLYRAKYGDDIQTGSGCGNSGSGSGWFNYSNGGTYPASILSCLTNNGYLNSGFIDPSGCSTNGGACAGKGVYMKYTCTYNGATISIIYTRLETKDESSKLTGFDGGANTCNSNTVVTSYGMNYMVIAD